MSELNTIQPRANIRWQLLTTVSVLTLCGAVYTQCAARAGDDDHPAVWIELGGQLERVESRQDAFVPPFLQTQPRPGFEEISSASTQRPPRYAIGGEAKAIFAPEGTDWSFLAAIRYGRSNSSKHLHQQTGGPRQSGVGLQGAPIYLTKSVTAFGDTDTKHAESHMIIDFMAGKDVGLGILGHNGAATFDFGFRFAQFESASSTILRELPDPLYKRTPQPPLPFFPQFHIYTTAQHHHTYYAAESVARSFSGIGPTISLSGSSPVIGDAESGEVAFDWGANAALLFGRQKVDGNAQTAGSYFNRTFNAGQSPKTSYSTGGSLARSRSVIVPNVGGFAGLTFRRSNAKVSLGYRADFFFGAMDGGVDTRHTSNVGFFGPFATISIGLGG